MPKRPALPASAEILSAVAAAAGRPRSSPGLDPTGAGRYNTSFFVRGWPRPMVIRVAPEDDPDLHLFYEYRMMRQEPGLHERLRAATDVPVAEVIAFREADPTLGRAFIVMERLPGKPLSEQPLDSAGADRVLARVGECLAQVHAIRSDRYGYVGPHRPMEPQPDWSAAFHVMWNKLLDDLTRCGGYAQEEAALFRRRLDSHAAAFRRPVPASLLHMDVWAENILCDARGRLTGLVDWDRALWGDPEIEFAVLDYCGISEPAFWEGYGARRDDSAEARVRRLFYFLYELQKYVFIRIARGGDHAGGERYRLRALELGRTLD